VIVDLERSNLIAPGAARQYVDKLTQGRLAKNNWQSIVFKMVLRSCQKPLTN
jgi:hypothetical protein